MVGTSVPVPGILSHISFPTILPTTLDVRGFHEGILTYHTMTHRYKEENER